MGGNPPFKETTCGNFVYTLNSLQLKLFGVSVAVVKVKGGASPDPKKTACHPGSDWEGVSQCHTR